MNFLGLVILCAVLLGVAFGSKRAAMLSALAGALYLTQTEAVFIFGFNLFAYRLVELTAFVRVMARGEFSFSRDLNRVDRALLWLYAFTAIVFVVRSADGQAYQVGTAMDAILCYFAFRGLVGDAEDFKAFLRSFLILLAPYAILVVAESLTGKNAFVSLEGFRSTGWLREGRLRCQGSFRHPSLLGTFGASFIPLYIGLAWRRADRMRAAIGIALCLAIVWASNSGGPLSCVVVTLAGWLLWRFRTGMRWLRRSTVVVLIALAVVMKAPVWYLLARMSALTGGDGWHRSYLIDVAFQNFGKWWLDGMPIRETASWFPYDLASTGGADITNAFLSFGIVAGVVAMILFFRLLVLAYRNLGEALAAARLAGNADGAEWFLWGLGVMLATHISNWLGITYFDQMYVIWFMQLAAIVNLSRPATAGEAAAEPVRARPLWGARVRRWGCSLALVAGLPLPALATAAYVDAAATGRGDGTSWTDAWTNLPAITGLAAGDTVYISGGPAGRSRTYLMAAEWSSIKGGTPGARITYEIGQDPAHNGTAVFRCTRGRARWIPPTSNVAVVGDAGDGRQHFLLSGWGSVILGSGQANVRLAYLRAEDLDVIGDFNPASGIEIDHCYFRITDLQADHATYAQIDGATWDNSRFHHNTLYIPNVGNGAGCDGLQWCGSGFSIYDNRIVGYVTRYAGGQHQDGWQGTGDSRYIKIYGNIFQDIANYPIFGDAYYGGFAHVRIYGNVIFLTNREIQASDAPQGIAIGPDGGSFGNLRRWPVFEDISVHGNLISDYGPHLAIALQNNPGQASVFTGCAVVNNTLVNSHGIGADAAVTATGNVSLTSAQAAATFRRYRPLRPDNDYRLAP